MRGLIKITYDNDQPLVSGRELHEFLEVDSNYTTWLSRMCEYGFAEGESYIPVLEDRVDGLPGKPRTDHQLTIKNNPLRRGAGGRINENPISNKDRPFNV